MITNCCQWLKLVLKKKYKQGGNLEINALQHSVSRSTVYPEGERHGVSHSLLAYSNRQKQKQFQLTPTHMS